MNSKHARLLALPVALAAALAASPVLAQNVAVVNGTPVPTERAKALIAQLTRQGQKESPELTKAVNQELITREVLWQEAARRGIQNQPDVKAQIALAQQSVVIRALIENFVKSNAPTDAELHARYSAIVQQMGGGKELHLHHILVADEKQAQDLTAKIKAGAKFEDLAKQYSKDPGSGKNGGDLDWAPAQTYVPEFAASAMKLQKGQVTDQPVHTQFGWHIIRLDDTRSAKLPAFDEVKTQLAQQVEQEKLQKYEASLVSQAKIK